MHENRSMPRNIIVKFQNTGVKGKILSALIMRGCSPQKQESKPRKTKRRETQLGRKTGDSEVDSEVPG